jgi:hypothetical protein
MADIDALVRRGVISDRAAQRMMTHMPEQPNPALPVIDAVSRFAKGGIAGVIGHRDRLGNILQSDAANTALGVLTPMRASIPAEIFERVPVEQRLSHTGVTHPGFRWAVTDKKSGQQIGDPYMSAVRASRTIDRLDNKYGGYRYQKVPIRAESPTEAELNQLNQLGIQLPAME